ncbi:MAG: hypothetical protein IJ475_01305 [Bacilli bacterium]|nr:hypothetical protein [Bacilli bacterium]
MKNLDWKKLAILIGIIIAVIAVIVLIIKGVTGETKATKEEATAAETIAINNIFNLTLGYETKYSGIDILFSKDKLTIEDITPSLLITSAIRYAVTNDWEITLDTYKLEQAKQLGYSLESYSPYDGETIRKAIKELYNIDFTNQSATDELNFRYNYYYIPTLDLYMKQTKSFYNSEQGFYVDYKIIETTKKGDKIMTKIAIAYVYSDGSKLTYTNDSNNNSIIFETEEETGIPDDKLESFDQFTITLKNVDGNYYFESIEKIK